MKKALLGICLALPLAAVAQDFSYDYLQAGYGKAESDDNNAGVDLDVYAAELGWAPGANAYTKFGFGYANVDDAPTDSRSVSAAVGGRVSLSDSVDFYLGALAAWSRVSDTGLNRDLDGYGLGAELGLRAWLFPQLELEANGTFLDLFEGDIEDMGGDTNDFTASLGARFHATPALSVGGGYSYAFDAETETLSAGVRYDF